MKRINLLLTFLSFTAVLIIVERLSFTTKIILQPYNFLRLHEVFQLLVIILISVLIPFFLLKEVTNNFELLKSKKGTLLGALFTAGLYFYATGNGVHEMASFGFNTFCDVDVIKPNLCGALFFNDYYFGNILYFFGILLSNIVLVLFERMNHIPAFSKKSMFVLAINSFIIALMLFAYAAFDKVLVGLVFIAISAIIFGFFLLTSKKNYGQLPLTFYFASSYTIATLLSVFIRFH